MARSKVTYDDIAREAGFSKTTISRYFSNPDSLTEKNQKKIADALKSLDYQENKIGRILASGRTEMIGLVVPNLYMHYFSSITTDFLATYTAYGYKFLVFEAHEDAELERRYLKELCAYNVEGIIEMSHNLSSQELASLHVPLVSIEREDDYITSVNTDNLMGGVQAASLLYKNNCDILFYLDGSNDCVTPALGRQLGFKQVCEEHQIPSKILVQDIGHGYQDNYRAISGIIDDISLKYVGKRKGIFAANDTYASMIVTHLLRSYGSFPDDFRLVGFDGSPISEQSVVPFSTIGQQIDKIVHGAMGLLTEQINCRINGQPDPPIRHKVITPVMICRDTSIPEALMNNRRGRYDT